MLQGDYRHGVEETSSGPLDAFPLTTTLWSKPGMCHQCRLECAISDGDDRVGWPLLNQGLPTKVR